MDDYILKIEGYVLCRYLKFHYKKPKHIEIATYFTVNEIVNLKEYINNERNHLTIHI